MSMTRQLNGLKGLFPYLKARKGKLILLLFLSLVVAALGLLPIQIVAGIVDVLSTGTSCFFAVLGNRVERYVLLYAAVYLAKQAIDIYYGHAANMLAHEIIESIRDDAMLWTMRTFKPYKEDMKEGDVTSRISADVEWVVRAVAGPLNGFLPMVLQMIGSVAILLAWNAALGLVALALIVPLFLASKRVAMHSKQIAAKERAANGKLVGAISDVLFGMPIIKAWQSEAFEAEYFHRSSHAIFDLNEQNQRAFDLYWGITCLLKATGSLAAIALSVRSVLAGAMTIGSISVAYSYMSNVLSPAVSVSRYGNDLLQADASLARVFALKPKADRPGEPMALRCAPRIEFVGVSIDCNDTRRLEDLTFTAEPNDLLVLAGESGSGKSTILNTLLGNQPPAGGRILVDGVEMTNRLGDLRSAISVSFQEAYLFDRSLGENVAYTCKDPDQGRAKAILRASGLGALADERGLTFEVGTKGKALSGGERRRVSFARAVYRKVPLYIFDEPTSEMDPETSRVVIRQILDLKKRATVIVASHDAQLIEQADKVVSLQAPAQRA